MLCGDTLGPRTDTSPDTPAVRPERRGGHRLLGTASPNRYSTIALVNQVYWESTLGNEAAARVLFEFLLEEGPGADQQADGD